METVKNQIAIKEEKKTFFLSFLIVKFNLSFRQKLKKAKKKFIVWIIRVSFRMSFQFFYDFFLSYYKFLFQLDFSREILCAKYHKSFVFEDIWVFFIEERWYCRFFEKLRNSIKEMKFYFSLNNLTSFSEVKMFERI